MSLFDKAFSAIIVIVIFLSIIISDYFRDYKKEIYISSLKFQVSFVIITIAYLFLLIWSIYIVLKIKSFRRLIEELLNQKEYPSLIEIVANEYKRLIKFSNKMSFF